MTVPSVQILRAEVEHLPAIAQLAAVIWRRHYPRIISHGQIEFMLAQMYSLDTLRIEISSKGIRFYRLMVEERFVGFAAIGPTDAADTVKLHKLYLQPELHGKGFGTRLLKHCESEARQLGARRLVLAVNKRNARAIAVYQRNGFTIVEPVINDIGGGFVMDDFIMGKDLEQKAE